MLPLLISTPHSSDKVPPWLMMEMLKSGGTEAGLRRRLLRQGDPFTDELFRIPDAAFTINASVSRFVADLNRRRNEPGINGVIKLRDFNRQSFYAPGYELTEKEREKRLSQYYDPYHESIEKALKKKDIRFFIDGHSMNAQGPEIGPDHGEDRPAICIGNFGDADGEPTGEEKVSCPPPLVRKIRDLCETLLQDVLREAALPKGVLLNNPFDGGHVLRRYSAPPFSIPGVMIEVNRALYLDEGPLQPLPGRVAKISAAFQKLAAAIVAELA